MSWLADYARGDLDPSPPPTPSQRRWRRQRNAFLMTLAFVSLVLTALVLVGAIVVLKATPSLPVDINPHVKGAIPIHPATPAPPKPH